jgi:hypothetical protein
MTASGEPVLAEPALQRRYPDFFIVGHAKCGTTALYEMLSQHPQIYMPSVKEPMFFARNPAPPASGSRRASFEQTGRRSESLEDYLALFAGARADQRAGEASTFYLWSEQAPARIAAARPDARIIAIFREPASFVRSLHLQAVQNHAEPQKDLRKAIALEEQRRHGRRIPRSAHWPRALMYTERVRYVEQLRRYHDVFPREQVLVLIYDDFRSDNDASVRRVLRFLDVDDGVSLEASEANPTVAMRSLHVDRMIRGVRAGRGPLSGAAKAAVRGVTPAGLRTRLLRALQPRVLYGDPRPPDEAFMQELRGRFKGEVQALSEYLGRDLVKLWGYEHVV